MVDSTSVGSLVHPILFQCSYLGHPSFSKLLTTSSSKETGMPAVNMAVFIAMPGLPPGFLTQAKRGEASLMSR